MNKQIVLLFLGFLIWEYGPAQTFIPSAIIPQGSVSEVNDVSLEWTLGEVFIHTVDHENGMITQGSQQPFLLIEELSLYDTESIFKEIGILLYPNPVEQILHVQLSAKEEQQLVLTLTDAYGKEVLETTGNTSFDQLSFDMTGLSAGMYYLRISNQEGTTVKTFKVSLVRS